MEADIYQKISDLNDKFQSKELGKVIQKMLALSFNKVGFKNIEENSIQGVDINMEDEIGNRYSIEVKTSGTRMLSLGEKDIKGLLMKKKHGNKIGVAALHRALFSDWMFIKADELKAGRFNLDGFRAHLMPEINTDIVIKAFNQLLNNNYIGIISSSNPQTYMDDILKANGVGFVR
jgi:hypothetical protein